MGKSWEKQIGTCYLGRERTIELITLPNEPKPLSVTSWKVIELRFKICVVCENLLL
jgi:hypothetical protein